MSSPDARDRHEAVRARLERDLQAAASAVRAEPDDEAAIRLATWVTERLRAAMIAMGEVRGARAVRLRESRRISFTDLGRILGVTRARAQEIVTDARRKLADPSLPVIALAVVTSPAGVLISKRTDRTPPWSFIGGESESGESIMEAAVREVREETGAEAVAVEVIGRREHPATGRTVAYVGCRLADPGARVSVADTDELAEVRWADLGDARLLMPSMYGPVAAYLERVLGA